MIHVNQRVSRFIFGGVIDMDETCKVFRYVCAGINLMSELLQRQREWEVLPAKPQAEIECLVSNSYRLARVDRSRDKPGA